MRAWWVLVLAGCNRLLGLDTTTEVDAPVDAPQLLVPPPDAGPCTTPFDFSNLTYDELADTGGPVIGISMYRLDGAPRMMMTRSDPVAFFGTIVDWDLVGAPAVIPALTMSNRYSNLGVSPGGEAAWIALQTGDQALIATRANGWAPQVVDLGLPLGSHVFPGSVGYYGGTARMVLRTGGPVSTKIVEISSADGEHWSLLDTIQLADTANDPSLSIDGCVLTYTTASALRASYRDPDGVFRTAVSISNPYAGVVAATMSPDLADLWLVVNDGLTGALNFARGHH